MKRRLHVDPEWFDEYEVRTGKDGKSGIYLREFNVRLATFNCNTGAIQSRLKLLFDRAVAPAPPKPKRKRKPVISGPFSMDIGDNQGWGKKR